MVPPLLTTDLPVRTRSDTLGSLEDTPVPKERTDGLPVDVRYNLIDQNNTPKPRVLVVDDNSINLSLMLTFLQRHKLETLDSADNGSTAVQAVKDVQEGYDIIFMDLSMPVMNGFEATRAIRAFEKGKTVDGRGAMIIALTGLSSPKDETEALASGIDLFLTKPVSFKEVARLLGEWERRSLGLSHVQ